MIELGFLEGKEIQMLKKFIILSIFISLALFMNSCASSPGIVNIQWEWSTITSGIAQQPVENSEDYVLVFWEDGTFNADVDCNSVSGTYTQGENELSLTFGPTTLAECGPDSLYDSLMGFLPHVESYNLDGNDLTLFLSDGSTRLGFKNAGPAE